jgi:hypothetical protein
MTTELYDLYNTYTSKQLFDIIINKKDYNPEAVYVAEKIVKEKRLITEFQIYIEEYKIKTNEEQNHEEYSQEYYQNIVDFKNNHTFYDIKLEDIAKFEEKLNENKIEFFKEEELIKIRNGSELIQSYSIKNEDVEQVEKIIVELDIIPQSLHDKPGLYKFEIITILILLITIVLMMFLQ